MTGGENLKLAMAWKPTLSLSILVVYPHLNQGEWISLLVHSWHKLDSMVGDGAKGQWNIYCIYDVFKKKKKKTKQNWSDSDSKGETADFPRFIVIGSLEEACLAKFSPFLIEKVISTKLLRKILIKPGTAICLMRWTARGKQKAC